MPTMGVDLKPIALIEFPVLRLIVEAQSGTALENEHPLVFLLVVPAVRRAGGLAGMDLLQPQLRSVDQHPHPFFAGGRTGARQQIAPLRQREPSGLLTPAAADLEATGAGQLHHLLVMGAVPQGLTQLRPLFAEGDKGIELADFL
jgi:hypothetical protein